jgi:hypothetical protein
MAGAPAWRGGYPTAMHPAAGGPAAAVRPRSALPQPLGAA